MTKSVRPLDWSSHVLGTLGSALYKEASKGLDYLLINSWHQDSADMGRPWDSTSWAKVQFTIVHGDTGHQLARESIFYCCYGVVGQN